MKVKYECACKFDICHRCGIERHMFKSVEDALLVDIELCKNCFEICFDDIEFKTIGHRKEIKKEILFIGLYFVGLVLAFIVSGAFLHYVGLD